MAKATEEQNVEEQDEQATNENSEAEETAKAESETDEEPATEALEEEPEVETEPDSSADSESVPEAKPEDSSLDLAPAVEIAAEVADSAVEDVGAVSPLSRPAVIDFEALLKPISDEAPSGQYMRYEGIYDEISEERRADEDLEQGAWQSDLKIANFPKVIELATDTLTNKSKDLQIAAWLSEALVSEHGFSGLRDSLKMFSALIRMFWADIFPEIDEGDEEGRANAIAWFDRKAGFLIQKAPILNNEDCSYTGYLDSKKFDIPDDLDSLDTETKQQFLALRETAEKENRVTAAKWSQSVALTKRAFCEENKIAIEECSDALKELNQAIEETFDRNQAPGVRSLGKALAEIDSVASKLLDQKRIEEPDPSDFQEAEEGEGGEGTVEGRTVSGPVKDREDALRKLSEIASFFRRTEPHSPVAYLVNRAVNWGNMPLESWLQDVIKDENILFQLRQTLGFNTAPSGESQTENE
ncbi:MAG: type VI secretion system protein TssA [Pyrinomonadaceae bacterium]|nr:type VI secretion system protein TssA [Pyrinomonadaceae bacterium]